MRKGVTLAELLVLSVLLLLIVGIFSGANYFTYIKRANDSKRKNHLKIMREALEAYYSDHNHYPAVSEMTYQYMSDTQNAGKICGDKKTGASIKPYIKELPCGLHGNDYVYFLYDNGQSFSIFTRLEDLQDPAIEEVGCTKGCSYYYDERDPYGSLSDNVFNYYVSSSSYDFGFCPPTYYWACYKGKDNPCRICPNLNCESGYTEVYCSPSWCVENCK